MITSKLTYQRNRSKTDAKTSYGVQFKMLSMLFLLCCFFVIKSSFVVFDLSFDSTIITRCVAVRCVQGSELGGNRFVIIS